MFEERLRVSCEHIADESQLKSNRIVDKELFINS